jgi:hypothetical protein
LDVGGARERGSRTGAQILDQQFVADRARVDRVKAGQVEIVEAERDLFLWQYDDFRDRDRPAFDEWRCR